MATATLDHAQKAKLEEREKQIKQAEELLFTGPQEMGFAKSLFYGHFAADWVMPYPAIVRGKKPEVDAKVDEVAAYCRDKLDPEEIDRKAEIPQSLIDDLGRIGVLGLTAPKAFGGHDFTQSDYCRVLELVGGRCSATSIFVNAHHSIGIRALLLFGTKQQQERWLKPLVAGKELAAFALTEPEAGSDAANVQTTATPSEDGSHFILNGEKRYITNGGIAQCLTVMARTLVPGSKETKVTAFLVSPDMPGFKVTEKRFPKLGIRGTATGWLKFENMKVPKENVLGPMGKGLKVALTVLDFGRTTFGACCTGAAKTCLKLTVAHATKRRQFNRTLAEFELVQKKIAQMAAWIYAMESMTYVTAGLIDRGLEDFMLETAMLKVWSTEVLWTMVNDTFQIHGGAAYFDDNPMGRILRDARINQIGEGANDVLRSFIAMVGMKGPAEGLQNILKATKKFNPVPGLQFVTDRFKARIGNPEVPVKNSKLIGYAQQLSGLIKRFERSMLKQMFKHREEIIERQYVHERIAEVAMELFASACVLSRIDSEMSTDGHDHSHSNGSSNGHVPYGSSHAVPANFPVAEFFLQMSARRMRGLLDGLDSNDDDACDAAAKSVLAAAGIGK